MPPSMFSFFAMLAAIVLGSMFSLFAMLATVVLASMFSLFAIPAAVLASIYALFIRKRKDDPSTTKQSPPHTSCSQTALTSAYRGHDRDPYYYSSRAATTLPVNSRSTPSASTHAQPYYQHPWIETRTAQTTANKENLGYSHHLYRHGLASSSQTVPTSAAGAQIPHPTQSTASYVRKTTSTTSDHLDPLHRTIISSGGWDSRLAPSTSAFLHTSYAQAAQQTSVRGAQTTARTTTRTDFDSNFHRSDFASCSSVWGSRQCQTTPTHTYPSYSAEQTFARVSQTTSTTPTRTDRDSSLHRSDFASPSVWESRQTPSTPTRTHALYSIQQTSVGVNRTTVRTPTMADYDDMGPSPYYYLRTPSPDASHARVSRLTVSPKKHSRRHSSSSDSDYLGPSSRTRAVPRSPGHEVHVAIIDAEDRKKAMELRDQAKRSAGDMSDARARAKIAHRRGDREAENKYRQEARAHESAKKNLDKSAAKIFFRVNNKAREALGAVDLHNLYVAEAVEYAKEELQSAIYRDDDTVRFIVGQGRHSENGVPKLRPALEKLFDEYLGDFS